MDALLDLSYLIDANLLIARVVLILLFTFQFVHAIPILYGEYTFFDYWHNFYQLTQYDKEEDAVSLNLNGAAGFTNRGNSVLVSNKTNQSAMSAENAETNNKLTDASMLKRRKTEPTESLKRPSNRVSNRVSNRISIRLKRSNAMLEKDQRNAKIRSKRDKEKTLIIDKEKFRLSKKGSTATIKMNENETQSTRSLKTVAAEPAPKTPAPPMPPKNFHEQAIKELDDDLNESLIAEPNSKGGRKTD